jgi:RNA polymerase sigma-70 factor, ECF subfamily
VDERPPQVADSDADRVRATLAGDRSAFGVLYDRYARLVRAVCHDATGDLAEAQDLCQDVFLRAYRNLEALRDAERFAGWLVGIARMAGREWRKRSARERRRRRPLDSDLVGPDGQNGSGDHGTGDDAADQLLEAIARLPERERIALHLFYLQEQPAEVAQGVMRLSRSGFYRVLDRARRRLRVALGVAELRGR